MIRLDYAFAELKYWIEIHTQLTFTLFHSMLLPYENTLLSTAYTV